MRISITGGANGIGRAAAVELVGDGHDVIVVDVDAEGMTTLPDEITTYEADVSDRERITSIVHDETFDVLVNNAGFQAWGAIEDVSPEILHRHFETNVYGLVYATQAALPMLRERRGRIVNVSSMASRFTAPYWGIYAATKHAVKAISDELRIELAEADVDVVTVEPGPVTTGFNERGLRHLESMPADSVYADSYREALETDDLGGATPDAAGAVLVRAATDPDPKVRYRITWYSKLLPRLRILLPERLWDRLVRMIA